MTLRHAVPVAWRPRGISDAVDASLARDGSMQQLANLVPDPSTLGNFIARPAATLLVDFNVVGSGPFSSGFSSGFQTTFFSNATAGQITCGELFGNRVYGMVSGPNNFDYPFVFDMLSKTLVFVTNGLSQTLLPTTVPTTGQWVPFPPVLALVGTKVILCHPGFTGGGPTNLFFGWFDITNPAAITWNAGNMSGGSAIIFSSPPWAVANFNGRAYWAINPSTGNPSLVFSDVLVPFNCTNATQVLTFDDQQQLTALAPLPLSNQVTGGIIQAIMVFKGTAQVYQVTGDSALNNLAKNALNLATGTNAPLVISVTPKGIGFLSPDGLRIIDFNATISDPIGWDGQGKTVPFIFLTNATRACGACTGTMFRIAIQDTTLFQTPTVEYWLDVVRMIWTGPHRFSNGSSGPVFLTNYNNTFVHSIAGIPGKLWQSDVVVSTTTTFVENGTTLNWNYLTSLLPDTDQMCENFMIETTIQMGVDLGSSYPAQFLDQNGNVLGSGNVFVPQVLGNPLWGTATWGAFTWGAPQTNLFPRPIPWTAPVVFRRGQFQINGKSSANTKISTLHCRYQKLGYLSQTVTA